MIFYLIGVLYFTFILEGMLKERRTWIIFFFNLLAMYPIASSLASDGKYITLVPIVSSVLIPMIAFTKFNFHRFMYSSFTLTTTAFYIAEFSITKHSSILSILLFGLSVLIVTSDRKIWYALLTALALALLSYTFTQSSPLTYVSFDYHIVYIPKLVFMSSILFIGLLVPFSISTQNSDTSPTVYHTIVISAVFAALHIKGFFSLQSLYEFPLLYVSEHLRLKFQIILIMFSLPFFILMVRTHVIFKYLTSILIIQSVFILFVTSNSTVELTDNNIINYSLAAFTINSMISFIILIHKEARIVNSYLSIFVTIISIITPLQLLFTLKSFSLINICYVSLFILFIYFSVKLLLLNRFFVANKAKLLRSEI